MKLPGGLLVVAPHLDDAVLSVGALMAAAKRSGQPVTVLTVFTGGPVGELSAAAIEDRTRYNNQDPLPIRLAEDAAAEALLGSAAIHAGIPELIFRRRPDGRPRCESLDDIFGPTQPDDASVIAEVADVIRSVCHPWTKSEDPGLSARVLVPLGIGNHVDHTIVRMAADSLGIPLSYYRDQPYVMRGDTLPELGRREQWEVTDADVEEWLEAIACYKTQLPILFEGSDWRSAFREYAKVAYLLR